MKNRFRHCSSKNEAVSLLCLLLSSEDEQEEKQALHDEYDTFISVMQTHEIIQFDNLQDVLDNQFLDEDRKEPEQEGYPYWEDVNYKDRPEDDYYDCEDYDEVAEADARELNDYPPGMTRADLIHVGEIDPDDE